MVLPLNVRIRQDDYVQMDSGVSQHRFPRQRFYRDPEARASLLQRQGVSSFMFVDGMLFSCSSSEGQCQEKYQMVQSAHG